MFMTKTISIGTKEEKLVRPGVASLHVISMSMSSTADAAVDTN